MALGAGGLSIGQGIDFDPPRLVIARSGETDVATEETFVERFLRYAPMGRTPVRWAERQATLDHDVSHAADLALGRAALEMALTAYGALKLDEANAAAAGAQRSYLRALSGRRERDDAHAALARATLVKAALWIVKGDAVAAESEMATALGLDSAIRFDSARFPPAMARTLDAVRARYIRRTLAVVDIASDPPGAEVEIGGVPFGVTPLKVRLRPGKRWVVFRRTAFVTALSGIDVGRDSTAFARLERGAAAQELAGWCSRLATHAGPTRVPASVANSFESRPLIIVEATKSDEFAVCFLLGAGDGEVVGRIPLDRGERATAALWSRVDTAMRAANLRRAAGGRAVDLTPTATPPKRVPLWRERRWYETWWLWGAVAAAIAGTSVGLYLGTRGPTTSGVAFRF